MKRNILKITIVLTLAVVILLGTSVPALALPYNTDITSNYTYDYWGNAVQAPVAYTVEHVYTMEELGVTGLFKPVDMFYCNGYLYIVDAGANRVLVYDEEFRQVSVISTLKDTEEYTIPALNMSYIDENGQIVYDNDMTSSDKYSLNAPEGIFVTADNELYIADTENRRIVVCDMYGNVSNVFQHLNLTIIKNFVFRPSKITVDTTGSMQIIAKAVNRGLLELDSDGRFRSFLGAPKIQVSASEWFWRSIASEEQKKKMTTFVPTEYSNLTKDDRGFMYATISSIEGATLLGAVQGGGVSGGTAPVAKLTAEGSDILRRLGQFPPVGDIVFTEDTAPRIVDCAVDNASGLYTILDETSGRFFTYNQNGDLLFIGGGSSFGQYGRFKTPTSIVVNGDLIYISDYGNKTVTVYEMTDYAKLVRSAIIANSAGEFQRSAEIWKEVASYNSNMHIAYVGIGKAEMRAAATIDDDTRLEHYENALYYFSLANEKTNYSKAFTELRTEKVSQYFSLIMGGALVIVVAIIVFVLVKKKKSKKEGAKD